MSRIGSAARLLTLTGAGALTACVAAGPATPYPQPLAAFPGPNKATTAFAQDDVACRALAAAPAPQPPPATTSPTSSVNAAATTPAPVQPTPASIYFSCMTSHGNVIAAAPTPAAAYYAQYAVLYPYAYGGYPYYGGFYPGFFADDFLLDRQVGLYGGFGFGGFYGYRGGFHGYHGGYGGYRGGYGGYRGPGRFGFRH